MTRRPTRQASAIECQNTKRRIVPSWPNQFVAVEATTMDWASIILPITPPEELAALIRTGEMPNCSAVVFCRFKVYKADKGFGFVTQDDGGKDVFVHARALRCGGLSGLAEGQRVR